MRYVGLLDCNNFFVSCERLFRPDLARRPVVVLSSNDGCVVARSQEVKDSGVPMGVPFFQVKDILSDIGAVTFSSHFSLYRDISQRVFNIAARHLGTIQPYSIDECFFLIDSDQAERTASLVKEAVWREVGIPVSIGIAASKTQAKYAASLAKKTNGIYVLTQAAWQEKQPTTLLRDIWGVGKGHTRAFSAQGLETVAQFLSLPLSVIEQRFGVTGGRLWVELQGSAQPQLTRGVLLPKSFTSSRSFSRTVSVQSELQAALSYHLYRVVKNAYTHRLAVTALRIFLYPSRHGDYVLQGFSAEAVLPTPTQDLFILERLVTDLLTQHIQAGVPYKKAGITVLVTPEEKQTLSLFCKDPTTKTKTESLSQMVFTLNARQTQPVVRIGTTAAISVSWLPKRELQSPEYTTAWEGLRVVKTDIANKRKDSCS
jgi:DNA polymerase V